MYYLRFALNIQWSGETSIVYTPESFAEAPISISKPEIVEMLRCFSESFQKVAVIATNAEAAKKLIDDSGLKVYSAIQLQEAADLVAKLIAKKHKQ